MDPWHAATSLNLLQEVVGTSEHTACEGHVNPEGLTGGSSIFLEPLNGEMPPAVPVILDSCSEGAAPGCGDAQLRSALRTPGPFPVRLGVNELGQQAEVAGGLVQAEAKGLSSRLAVGVQPLDGHSEAGTVALFDEGPDL